MSSVCEAVLDVVLTAYAISNLILDSGVAYGYKRWLIMRFFYEDVV